MSTITRAFRARCTSCPFSHRICFQREWLDAIKARPFQLLSIALLAGGFVLLYMLSPILDASWFYGAMPYLEFGLDSWYAGFYRAITYAFTVIMGLCVLSHIPESDTPFTDRGVNTMYVFLLHGFIVKTMQHLNWFETFRSTGGKVLLILFGVLLTWLLSSSWIKRGFGWIVEPNVGFLFNYRSKHRQERVESKHSNAKGVMPNLASLLRIHELRVTRYIRNTLASLLHQLPRVTPSWLVAFSFFQTWVPLISPRRARL